MKPVIVSFETPLVDDSGRVIAHQKRSAAVIHQPLPGGLELELAIIPGGRYTMGAAAGEGSEEERPAHPVEVATFALGRHLITQAQWQAVIGEPPLCRFSGGDRPVDSVSWHSAQSFCRQLPRLTGRAYRLPAEAEWEYACRAGTATPFAYGPTLTTDLANYQGDFTYGRGPRGVYRHETTPGGRFPPNAFGLFDMHGNLWEWCADGWHADYEGAPADGSAWVAGPARASVGRGGSWHEPPGAARSAARARLRPGDGDEFVGFRVALSLPGDLETAGQG
jgi:formylglycine-generating enzyme required for sulfatase activity